MSCNRGLLENMTIRPVSHSSVRKVTTSKLRRERIPSFVSVRRRSLVLSRRLILSALFFHEDLFFRNLKLILNQKASLVLRFRSTTTSHFNFKCFVMTKTPPICEQLVYSRCVNYRTSTQIEWNRNLHSKANAYGRARLKLKL
jgi:hypothetical protein